MTPSRPYLLKALYNWIIDNELTPHVVVDVNYPGVIVPKEYIEDEQIILSIAPQSIHGMEMKNNYLAFAARFAGVSRDIYLPIMSINAIYAEENRKGMVFAKETDNEQELDKKPKNKKRPNLKVIVSNPDLDKK